LRIGYLSPDFREHSVSYFARSFLGAHNHSAFEVVGYDNSRRPDAVTASIQAMTDQWRRVATLNDDQIASQIRDDRIDILVDLAGHMAGNRLLVFARRPAPVQVTYLGYPDTTGLRRIDYRLTDEIADPAGTSDSFNTERLIRLPGCAWCYTPPDSAPEISPLPAQTSGRLTLASFNNFAKVTLDVIALWVRVLNAVQGSQLLIKAAGLDYPSARQRVLEQFASAGISTDRLELLGRTRTTAEHLAMYQRCDIALDTFPYHGTTTSCEALWMGLPVITLLGQMHLSRVSASLLHAVDLDDCVAQNADEYVGIASAMSRDLARLAELRLSLRERMRGSPLLDAKAFTRGLEEQYRQMWVNWVTGQGAA
jgi:predicted O-linked N-acetylglucosamine transferase (SPINDLY family)